MSWLHRTGIGPDSFQRSGSGGTRAATDFAARLRLAPGVSGGLGRGSGRRVAGAGRGVAIRYATDADAERETRERVRATGAEGRIYKADVSERGQCEAMLAAIKDERGTSERLGPSAGTARCRDTALGMNSGWTDGRRS